MGKWWVFMQPYSWLQQHDKLAQIEELCYDILAAIHKFLSISTFEWTYQHIEGHQDKKSSMKELNRWGQLILVDSLAKGFILEAKSKPHHCNIKHDPWSLLHKKRKILQLAQTVYNLVHSLKARVYLWKKNN
jgi:hypothetical protein